MANTGDVLIDAQSIQFGDGQGTASSVKVVGIRSGNILNVGDEFILMQALDMSGDGEGATTTGVAQQGISLLYDVRTEVDVNGKVVRATILGEDSNENGNRGGGNGHGGNGGNGNPNGGGSGGKPAARVNPQLKALSEGYLAGAQLVMRGADLIADDAFNAINFQNNQNGWVPFAIMSGQHNRYNSGSHIKSNDLLLTGGLSYQQNNLTASAFVEAGWGSYDIYNSFYNAANVHGDGNSRYISAHMGVGYILNLSDKNQLDLSAKYLYSTLGGKDVNIAGDNIRFNRVDLHRARLNATLNHQYSETLTLNAGLGYEHEFDGKARATTYGIYNIDAPSVRGGTGIVSVGANIKPTSNQRLSLDIKANGYGGKREGVGASIRVNYAF